MQEFMYNFHSRFSIWVFIQNYMLNFMYNFHCILCVNFMCWFYVFRFHCNLSTDFMYSNFLLKFICNFVYIIFVNGFWNSLWIAKINHRGSWIHQHALKSKIHYVPCWEQLFFRWELSVLFKVPRLCSIRRAY